jgi:hypothetical protein
MTERKRKKTKAPVWDSIRKPTAPPTAKIGERRPEDRVHPSLRGTKYKKTDKSDE